jgi:hypothetical protein
MSWETRGGRRYYTRTRRRDGKVIREYIGAGPVGEQASAADAERRAERDARAMLRKAERARWVGAEALLQQLSADVHLLVRAAMVSSGFHRHDRGCWRRRRVE